ncbi:hypothetical protein ATDW_26220 [Asticcacaulis sp. DW145]|uniref:hypothetical protein n=1 Tax=Asticcacaulis sp. DW145 TaxID=3095608 RepID=UPI0030895B13|nr:hypothetical protein ATDW_26220 [Asticcacaulis sp. DW145]
MNNINLFMSMDSYRHYFQWKHYMIMRITKIVLLLFFINSSAFAQSITLPLPPRLESVDENGVDMNGHKITYPGHILSIGNEDSGLRINTTYNILNSYPDLGFVDIYKGEEGAVYIPIIRVDSNDQYSGSLEFRGEQNLVFINGYGLSDVMQAMSLGYEGRGQEGRLSCSADLGSSAGLCTYTHKSGVRLVFDQSRQRDNELTPNTQFSQIGTGVLIKVLKPDGEIIDITYENKTIPNNLCQKTCTNLKSVRSSAGWVILVSRYKDGEYSFKRDLKIINASQVYCNQYVTDCNSSDFVWQRAQENIVMSPGNVAERVVNTNHLGGQLVILTTKHPDHPTGVIRSPAGVEKYVVANPNNVFGNSVRDLTFRGVTWKYLGLCCLNNDMDGAAEWEAWSEAHRRGPDGNIDRRITYSLDGRLVYSTEDQLGRKTKYDYYINNSSQDGYFYYKIHRVIPPGASYNGNTLVGGYTEYKYDARGNVKKIISVPISGSNQNPIYVEYTYSASCDSSNFRYCDKPLRIIDPKGAQTDYTYDATHGGVLTETGPADANGVRPQTRYTYTPLYAKIKDANGNLVNAEGPIHKLTKVSTCKTATAANPASCVGTADEQVKEYAYNHNNLLMTSETVRSGDNSVSATTSYTYDYVGNVTSVDGPRTDVDDRSYTTWDVLRRKVFEIGPDPDGAGPLKRQIVKHYYDADSLEIRTEVGTGNNTDGSDFVWSSAKRMTYDGAAQLIKTEVVVP